MSPDRVKTHQSLHYQKSEIKNFVVFLTNNHDYHPRFIS
jgi:hypothetical protein